MHMYINIIGFSEDKAVQYSANLLRVLFLVCKLLHWAAILDDLFISFSMAKFSLSFESLESDCIPPILYCNRFG